MFKRMRRLKASDFNGIHGCPIVRSWRRSHREWTGGNGLVHATALWLMGRHAALPEVAAPEHDGTALAQDIEAVRQRGLRMSRKPKLVQSSACNRSQAAWTWLSHST